MLRTLGLLVVCIVFATPMLATGDSLNYLSLKDTIFLTSGNYNEKLFEHSIERKQTLYSLSKFYGLSVEELYYYNPGLKEQRIKLGQAIRVPIPNRAIIRYKDQGFEPSEHIPVYYIVRRGETMYRIAKVYFRMPIKDMMARNDLTDTALKAGQVLKVGWMKISGIPEEYRQSAGGPLARRNNAMKKIFRVEAAKLRQREHQGVAVWKKEAKEDSDLYALHRYAKLNSIVAVKNPMNNRTVYAKVMGRIPDTAYDNNVAVIVSPLAAKLLGAKDPRFFVRVNYLK
ncbi:MAG: LysM peptidoglycan-binding domain-containing protein [Bacteroidota bacterium]